MPGRETTTIEVSQDTWRRLTALKDAPGKSFDDVIQELLEETEGGTGGMIKGDETVSTDAAWHADDGGETTEAPHGEPPSPHTPLPAPVDDRHAIVDRVAASWEADDRVEDRRAAADAALRLLFERGQLGKREAIDELLPEFQVDAQDDETWWRSNCREAVREVASYSKAKQAYVLDD